ncbi:MAG: site-specific DNA-methyltransferase [Fimbriimonadaceae bacterium]|nr:site-specific DNA-methyltransferase [Fimbriimonadaceae bacterium]
MPELDFKGKEFVRNHHLTVPYRPLVPVPEKGIGEPDLTGNLIIHGDNLEALKALLPMYAGKVDCIFIDPPYNTGNEGWSYNDNVNSPVIKAWFTENPVGVDDALRHDKWCCMMWPRLKLLRDLLAETGSIWMTLDDNEIHRARLMFDEIFGIRQFVAMVEWQKVFARKNKAQVSVSHDHVLLFCKDKTQWVRNLLPRDEEQLASFSNPDNDPKGDWQDVSFSVTTEDAEKRADYRYSITLPNGERVQPPAGRHWNGKKERYETLRSDNRLWFGPDGDRTPREKIYLSEVQGGVVPDTWWTHQFAGSNQDAKREILEIFNGQEPFATPKPVSLVRRALDMTTGPHSIILDSFAGSGTTAHAVIEKFGRHAKFILVEMEEEADTVTAERVRRVIKGYPYQGTQRKTLFEKRLTWTEVRKGDALKQEALDAKAVHEADYDEIEVTVKDGVLKVIGVRNVKDHAPGLGGTFTYCELGDAVELEKLLSGGALPARNAVADYLIYLSGLDQNKLEQRAMPEDVRDFYLGTADGMHIWLLYRPDRKYLSSTDSALTLQTARAIHASDKQGRHRVFSPAKYVGTKQLRDEKIEIEHVPLPLALFRGHTD